jgi:hypothetical protein
MRTIHSEPGMYIGRNLDFGVLDRTADQSTPVAGSALTQSLATLAVEFDWRVLWAIQITTLLAVFVMGFLMTFVHDWRHFVCVGMMLAYFTTAGILAGYLIHIKKKLEEENE